MILIFSDHAWEDYIYWQNNDRKILKRITEEHIFIYKVTEDAIHIAQLRYHYR